LKFYKIEENNNPFVTKGEKESKVVRQGNRVDVYMTSIRSHFVKTGMLEGIRTPIVKYPVTTSNFPSSIYWDIHS